MRSLNNEIQNPPGNPGGIFLFKFFLTLVFFNLLNSLLHSQPKLEVKENKKDFHFVNRGEIVKLNYDILNAGNEPLIIQDAEVSCSCTTVDFPKQPIKSGQSSTITVQFNTTTVYGRQDREVKIISNDPGKPLYLHYKGEVSKNKPQ